ncbi:helix-turn-helix transcriptional regulator [Lentilactobacillus parafarraginis]|nr:helix-turn-helix transcriptional regulator [Lentilactobacillus parafarraginis]
MQVTAQLIHYRKLNHFTQSDLAKQIHVSRQTISNWETGHTYPDIQSLLLLCDLYQITLDDLIHDDMLAIKVRSSLKRTRRQILMSIICILTAYGALIAMKWFPFLLCVMLLSVATTLGCVVLINLFSRTRYLETNTYREILGYLRTGSVPPTHHMTRLRKTMLFIWGGILGIIIGLALTSVIAVYWLHWSIF